MRRLPEGVQRLGYRLAFHVLRIWWLVAPRGGEGVKCLLTDGGRVLLVRHTYGPRGRWEMPGGSVRRREPPLDAVRRELHEELGLEGLEPRLVVNLEVRVDRHHVRLHCYQAELRGHPLQLDRVEIAEARWFPRDALPETLSPYVRRVNELAG